MTSDPPRPATPSSFSIVRGQGTMTMRATPRVTLQVDRAMLVVNHPFGLGAGPTTHSNET